MGGVHFKLQLSNENCTAICGKGYNQQKLSLIFSTGAAATVTTQLFLFPVLADSSGRPWKAN